MQTKTIVKEQKILISIGLGSTLLVGLVLWLGLFSGVEHRLEDRFFSKRPIDERLLVIAIDDVSLEKLGQWPLPRATYAHLFEKLNDAQPRVVGFDVMLAEPSREGENDDRVLEDILKNLSYPLIFPIENRAKGLLKVAPLARFTGPQNVHLGHVNLTIDPDSIVRSIPAHIIIEDTAYNSFAENAISYSGITYQPFEDGQQRIVYTDAPGSIPHISLFEALTAPSATFENKIIFIGATAPDLHDEQAVPVSNGILMPGVEIQAHIANQLIHNWRLQELPPWYVLFWLLCASFLPVLLFSLTHRLRILIPLIIGALILHFLIVLTLFNTGIIVPFIYILGTGLLSPLTLFGWRYTRGEHEKRQLKHAFGKYVSPQVLEQILLHPDMVTLGGEKRLVTVLFSDIRSFTTLSEHTTPEELVDILNAYFTAMTNVILEEGGVLDKYIGDAIMAFWGAPLPDEDQADAALRASQKMILRLKELNQKLAGEGKPTLSNGIGLYTGPAIAGNIGSEKRFDYTVIGDTVNVASRLEGLTKEYKTTLIIGESTKNALKEGAHITYLDEVKVKGREEHVKIYSVTI
jgi:adenylate cyclase